MATPKKPAATKKPRTPKSTSKKSSATTRASGTKKLSSATKARHSFTLQPDSQSFFSLRPTTQTLYWAVFAITVLLLGLWVLKLHLAVEELYNNIDANHAAYEITSDQLKGLAQTDR